MKLRWRFVAVVLIAAAALCLGSALVVAWRVHRVLQLTSSAVNAEENFAVDVRPVDLTASSRFDWLPAPAVFSAGAPYQGKLYLCGSSGLYEYSATGDLLHVYRVGQQLPIARLVTLVTGTLGDSRQPELLIATSGGESSPSTERTSARSSLSPPALPTASTPTPTPSPPCCRSPPDACSSAPPNAACSGR